MPILKPVQKDIKKTKKHTFKQSLLEEIEAYCQWAKIKDENDFLISSSEYILSKDRQWIAHKNKNQHTTKEIT